MDEFQVYKSLRKHNSTKQEPHDQHLNIVTKYGRDILHTI